ncbi:glomulin isoform X2 [Protopterus annectens]|nr:glomulin isoform X2 [Protopterus annectens]
MDLEEFHRMIDRCQGLPEVDFKEEDFVQFHLASQKCIEKGHTDVLLEIILDEKNKDIVRCMGWNLVSPLVRCVLQNKADGSYDHCVTMLDEIIELCNPKELLIGLLEPIEEAVGEKISQTIVLLLQPLQTVLLKLGKKKAYSVGLSLSTILSQISKLPVPYTKEQEQDDKYGLCKCCTAMLNFMKPFVKEIGEARGCVTENKTNEELRKELLNFCMKSLEYPLLRAQLDVAHDETEKQPLRQFASDILVIILHLGECLSKLLISHGCHQWARKENSEKIQKEDAVFSADSLACLAYFVFVQQTGADHFPSVFSSSFILHFNMEYIAVLLKRTEESVVSKGLDLFESCLLKMEDNHLLHQYLEIKDFLNVPQDLVKVMTLCPSEHLRKRSLKILQIYIDKFDIEGKYKLFRCLLKTCSHAGLQGYIIQNIKNQIDLALKPQHENLWFSEQRLIPLVLLVLSLPEGAETDLLQNSDRIMASLNLLRYLLIRDDESENR